MEQETKIAPNHALFSWMEDEDTVLTNGAVSSNSGAPQVQSGYNLWSKRLFTRENVDMQGRFSADKVPEQSAASVTYPRKEFIPYNLREIKALVSSVLDVVE